MIDLRQMRTRLLAERAALVSKRNGITADLQRAANPLSADFEEQAAECENDEVLQHLAESTASEIAEIDRALFRMSGKQYGICTKCGNPIGHRRLIVRPQASLCVRCGEPEGGAV